MQINPHPANLQSEEEKRNTDANVFFNFVIGLNLKFKCLLSLQYLTVLIQPLKTKTFERFF